MALNGLDHAGIQEAFAAAANDTGGWFLLKYATRDEVELFEQGTGGISDCRNAIAGYEEPSPLYGFLKYRGKSVIVKYMPGDCSRLIQVRATVHFNAVCDQFTHDSIFEIATASELKDKQLSAACSLPGLPGSQSSSSSSTRRRRLGEIAEEDEEEERGRKRQSMLQEDDRPSTSASPSGLSDVNTRSRTSDDPVILDAEQVSSTKFATTTDVPVFEGIDDLYSAGAADYARRASSQSTRVDRYGSAYSRPKVKLGPRPSLDTAKRPHTADNFRPTAALPAGFKGFSKNAKKTKADEKEQHGEQDTAEGDAPDGSLGRAFVIPENTATDHLALPPRPATSSGASVKSVSTIISTTTKENKITPEKARLIKAMKMREKKRKMNMTQPGPPPTQDLPPPPNKDAETANSSTGSESTSESIPAPNDAPVSATSDLPESNLSNSDATSEHSDSDSRPQSAAGASLSEVGDSTKASSISDSTDETVHPRKSSIGHLSDDEEEDGPEEISEILEEAGIEIGASEDTGKAFADDSEGNKDIKQATQGEPDVSSTSAENVSAESIEATSVHSQEASPELSAESTLDIKEEVLSEAREETIPEVDMQEENMDIQQEASPPINEEATPQLNKEKTFEVMEETVPELSNEATPETNQEVATDASQDKNPETLEEAVPEVSDVATPQTKEQNAPEMNEDAIPEVREQKSSEASMATADLGNTTNTTTDAAVPMSEDTEPATKSPRGVPLSKFSSSDAKPASTPKTPNSKAPTLKSKFSPHDLEAPAESVPPVPVIVTQTATPIKAGEGNEASEVEPTTTEETVVLQPTSQEVAPRKSSLDPIKTDVSDNHCPEDSDMLDPLDDTELMDELESATVQEAKPMIVSKSPIMPVFPASNPSKSSQWVAPQTSLARTKSNPLRGPLLAPSDVSQSTARSISDSGAAYLHNITRQPSGASLQSKKGNMGSSISQRIKALEQLSSTPGVADTKGRAPAPSSTFYAVRKAPVRRHSKSPSVTERAGHLSQCPTPESVDSRPVTPEIGTEGTRHHGRTNSMANRLSMFEGYNAPRGRPESIQVTARILRDGHEGIAKKLEPAKTGPAELRQSPLIVDVQTRKPTTSDGLTSKVDHFSHAERPYSERKRSIDLLSEEQADHKRRSSINLVKGFLGKSSDNLALGAGAVKSPTRNSVAGQSANRGFAGRDSDPFYPQATSPVPLSDNETEDEAKKNTRTSRFMRRLSSSFGGPRKNPSAAVSPTLPEEGASGAAAYATPAASDAQQSIVAYIGDVNVQFPDNLLWKRRSLCLDTQGWLLLSAVHGATACGKDKVTGAGLKRYHMSEFKKPYSPDVEVQELPNSVVLDLIQGSCLQVACGDRSGQTQVLDVLLEAYEKHGAFGR